MTDPRAWLGGAWRDARQALLRLARAPLATLTTSAVIGITLVLPLALYLVASHLRPLAGGWDEGASLSLFLRDTVADDALPTLRQRLLRLPGVAAVRIIDRAAALAEFRRYSGFGEALKLLPDNPLPAVLVVRPARDSDAQAIERLAARLRALPQVDQVQVDHAWLERLRALQHLLSRATWILGALLGLAVLLTIGNTVRLEIQHRAEEIRVSKLIGASDGFIRRPFLYAGVWYGLFGAVIAWWLSTISLILIAPPLRELAGLYEYQTQASALSLGEFLALLGIGAALGLLGAWLAVSRHLREIEPD